MNEKRNLETTIVNKNKQIETLNLKVQQMMGFHKRDIEKLEEDLAQAKEDHNKWLERQQKETSDWHAEREELNGKIDELNKHIASSNKHHLEKENQLSETINKRGLQIADLKGTIHQLETKIKHLASKNQVEV